MDDFEPVIVGFCCNWCSYAGADLAGVSRFQYAPNIRIIRVICSGRLSKLRPERGWQLSLGLDQENRRSTYWKDADFDALKI